MRALNSNFEKKTQFLPGYLFKFVGKNYIDGGQRAPGVYIVVNYCCTQNIPKETKTEETIRFFVTFFIIDGILIGRARPLFPGYAYAFDLLQTLQLFKARFDDFLRSFPFRMIVL